VTESDARTGPSSSPGSSFALFCPQPGRGRRCRALRREPAATDPVFRAPSPPKFQLRASGSERAEKKIFKVPEARNGALSDTTLDAASMSASVQAMRRVNGGSKCEALRVRGRPSG